MRVNSGDYTCYVNLFTDTVYIQRGGETVEKVDVDVGVNSFSLMDYQIACYKCYAYAIAQSMADRNI